MNTFGIDERVWQSVVGRKKVTPSLVALAASVCPEVLGEIAKWKPYESLLLTETSDMALLGGMSSVQIRNGLVTWVMSFESAKSPLKALGLWDRRLAAWCACALADTVLKYFPDGEERPHIAVETTRCWVVGSATKQQVMKALRGVDYMRGRVLLEDRSRVIMYASHVVENAGHSPFHPSGALDAAVYAGYASGVARLGEDAVRTWRALVRVSNIELVRLREVVAQAIVDFPSEDTIAKRVPPLIAPRSDDWMYELHM